MSKIGIIGWALSEFKDRREEISRNELIYEVTRKALDHAGLEIDQIDNIVSASCDTVDGVSISNSFAVDEMGAFMKEESKVEQDGAYAAMYAYYRLLTGLWNSCLVVAYGKISDSGPAFYHNMTCDPFLLRPLGVEGISAAALQCRAYGHCYGVSESDSAAVVVKNRRNGSMNDATWLRSPVTAEDVLGSPILASPIRELEAPPVTDGAAAVVLVNERFTADSARPPVWIEGVGFSQDLYYPGYKDLAGSASARAAAAMAYREAGVKNPLKELDMAELTERFAFYELLLYEALGLCRPGKGKNLIAEGTTDREGLFPVNPSGGALCADPIMATGLVRIVECCRQLRGQAGGHQLPGVVRRALAHGTSGLFLQSNIVFILGGE